MKLNPVAESEDKFQKSDTSPFPSVPRRAFFKVLAYTQKHFEHLYSYI